MNERLKQIIDDSTAIVLLSGAGISCGSGIPDFRSANGLYSQKTNARYSPEEIISHDVLYDDSATFYEFYKSKMVYPNAKPNTAHLFFAELEREGKLIAVVTQNIDGLHQKAGSKIVYELHGSVEKNYCTDCGKKFGLGYVMKQKGVPKCDECGSMVRPNVVMYGEPLDDDVWNNAIDAIKKADCLIVVGTSLTVYPAAYLVKFFSGKHLVLINKQNTPYDGDAELVLHEDIEEVIKETNKAENGK